MIDAELLTRPSGLYRVDGFHVGEAPITLTFPTDFEVPDLNGVTLPAFVFATRPNSSHPIWCDFKHPTDGRWRSVFAQREWVSGAEHETVKRGPFKRPQGPRP